MNQRAIQLIPPSAALEVVRSEIQAGSDQKDTKTQELADTDEKLAQAKQVQLMPYLSKSKICREMR